MRPFMYIPKTGAALATVAGLTLSCLLAACAVDRRNEVTDHVPPPLALEGTAYETALQIELAETSAREDSGLYNVFTLSDSIVSGSEPEGEEAFRVLQSMGINTIVSVDGKVPNEDLATSLGMTYVHVPIHYSGISEDELTRLAKTFREKDGPFYVHCFHGKHRGPAAAAVGRLVVDGIPREQALAEMHLCGTSSSYEGLYLSIAEGHIAEREATDDYEWDFPAAHPFGGFRQAMVEISRVDDSLEYLSLNGWEPSDNHPDLDAVNEATRLASALLRSSELDDVADKPADFHSWMGDAVKASTELRDALEAWTRGSGSAALAGTDSGVGIDDVDRAFDALSQSCKACHEAYRND